VELGVRSLNPAAKCPTTQVLSLAVTSALLLAGVATPSRAVSDGPPGRCWACSPHPASRLLVGWSRRGTHRAPCPRGAGRPAPGRRRGGFADPRWSWTSVTNFGRPAGMPGVVAQGSDHHRSAGTGCHSAWA
jgi:hypothetical protein